MAVRILVVEATRTGWCSRRCHSTAPVAASMTTAARASTWGAGEAAAGVATHPTTRPSDRTRDGNHRWWERTPVGCPTRGEERNTGRGSDPDGGGQRRAPPPGDRRELDAGPSTDARLRLRGTRVAGPSTGFHRTLRRYLQGWHNLVQFAHELDCLGPPG